MPPATILSLGAALVDTEVRVSEQDLNNLGLSKGLMTLSNARQQEKNLSHLKEHIGEFRRSSGGSAANSMIAVARLGGEAHLTCQVANDENGQFFLADLLAAGVSYNRQHQSIPGVTGTCLVLITPDAERTMNTCLAASEQLSPQNIELDISQGAAMLYLEGYLCTSNSCHQAALRYAELARSRGIPVALTLSDPGIVQHFRSQLEAICNEGIQCLFANLQEAETWTCCEGIAAVCRTLDQNLDEYCITLGAEGVIVGLQGRHWKVPATEVKAVDSNGAGDAFAGVYLHARTAGMPAPAAASAACFAAGLVVSDMGPRLSEDQAVLVRQQVEKLSAMDEAAFEALQF